MPCLTSVSPRARSLPVAGSNSTSRRTMRSRFMKLGVTVAALASLAVGGSAIATAAQKGGAPAPAVSTTTPTTPADTPSASDGDNIQQGDQSTPDVAGATDPAEAAGAAEAPDSA